MSSTWRNASSDRQRYEHLVGDRPDHVVEKAARLDAGADIQERDLVGALTVVATRDLDRIAGIAQIDEIDALDDAALGDVEAGNDALGETHGWRCESVGRVSARVRGPE